MLELGIATLVLLFALSVLLADVRHRQLLAKLNAVLHQGGRLMTEAQDINAKLDEIDATTNEIAGDLDEVIGQLPAAGGLTADEVVGLKARLSGHSDTLKAIAAKVPEPPAEG